MDIRPRELTHSRLWLLFSPCPSRLPLFLFLKWKGVLLQSDGERERKRERKRVAPTRDSANRGTANRRINTPSSNCGVTSVGSDHERERRRLHFALFLSLPLFLPSSQNALICMELDNDGFAARDSREHYNFAVNTPI